MRCIARKKKKVETVSTVQKNSAIQPDMLSTCLLSDVFQIQGCLADLDVGAMVCMLTHVSGLPLI